jgi:hypothetical protein
MWFGRSLAVNHATHPQSRASTAQMTIRLVLLSFSLIVQAQDNTALIHIRLIDGRTGLPMKVKEVGLEDRAGYRDISVKQDSSGLAELRISRDTIILTHNTHEYVNCADERGGLISNSYRVSEIVATGIVEPIVPPNRCTKTSSSAKPGELILFVRPWEPGEDM